MQPGHSYARARLEAFGLGAAAGDAANHLMARNDGLLARRQLTFDNVQIGTADAAGVYAHQHFSGAGLGLSGVGECQRIPLNRGGRFENTGFHN